MIWEAFPALTIPLFHGTVSWEATSPYPCCPGGEGLKDRAGQPRLLLIHKNCSCLKTANIYPWHIPPRARSCCWNSLIPRGHLALEPARAERPQILQPSSCTAKASQSREGGFNYAAVSMATSPIKWLSTRALSSLLSSASGTMRPG